MRSTSTNTRTINPRAATFRDAEGRVVGTTWGGTWCWHPINPSKYATVSEDGEDVHIIRCRECPGCLELDRRLLADRLMATFCEEVRSIWVVMVEASMEMAARICLSLRRTLKWSRVWGWCRIGGSHIAIVVAGQKPFVPVVRLWHGLKVSLIRVSKTRKRRAWRGVTAGILYSRSVYGENVNRWYIRNLKNVERVKRVAVWRGSGRSSHPEMLAGVAGVRAGVSIHPPEAYRPPRLVKRRSHGVGRFARARGNVEPIGAVLADLPFLSASTTFAITSSQVAGEAGAPNKSNAEIALRAPFSQEQRSTKLIGRYSSSHELDRAEIDAWVARMTEKARVRGAPDG